MAQRQNTQLKVSELDFDQIKTNLKDFLRSQSVLRDYDFEGSALNTLIDLMSYVTHYNAVNANIGINETFLDTAQYRGSVVSHARQLGYTPRSTTSATASVQVTLNGVTNTPVTLQKFHKFTTSINGGQYNFYTVDSYQSTTGIFSNVELKEGSLKTVEYIFDSNTSERFVIPDSNVDTSVLDVKIRDQDTMTYEEFKLANDLNEITAESAAYFLNETFDGRYEITFGDGVIGKGLANGNLIQITYLASNGEEGNGARSFKSSTNIGGYSNISITAIDSASGGSAKETIAEIKRRAPLTYASQNRAVTLDDFKSIILRNYSGIDSISVWGGEDNDPPQYGKVFISIKPTGAATLSETQKAFVLDNIVKPKCVATIIPEIIDPDYTYLSMEVFYKYNDSKTSVSTIDLSNLVRTTIQNYNTSQLNKSDGVLRYSSLLNYIDTTDTSIINSIARIYMKKRFVPVINSTEIEYQLAFSSPIYESPTKTNVIYDSSIFTYNGQQCKFADYIDTNGERKLKIIKITDVGQTVIAQNVGYVDVNNGKIVIFKGFNPSAFVGSYIEITVVPNSNDIAPKRNNLLSIDLDDVYIEGMVDNTLSGSNVNYSLISRH